MSTILDLMNKPKIDDASDKKKIFKLCVVEFIATAIFVTMGTLSAVSTGTQLGGGSGVGTNVARVWPIAFAFGISIMCLVYAIGHITGGHMNPAVSLLMYFERKISFKKFMYYLIAQIHGALLGSAMVWGCVASETFKEQYGKAPFLLGANTMDPQLNAGNGFLLEFIGSFFFFFVISQTALDKKGIASTNFFAIPIGFSLVVVHICLIPFTGCGVNPARTFGPALIVCMSKNGNCRQVVPNYWWIYFVAPFLASFVVAEITNLIDWAEADDSEKKENDEEES